MVLDFTFPLDAVGRISVRVLTGKTVSSLSVRMDCYGVTAWEAAS